MTGRPRRCGWLDIPLLRYSNQVNGAEWLVVTKLDVLDTLAEIPICVGYEIDGKVTDEIPADVEGLERIKPVYTTLKGWQESTEGITEFDRLPAAARSICAFRSGRAARKSAWFPRDRTGTRRWCCRSLRRRWIDSRIDLTRAEAARRPGRKRNRNHGQFYCSDEFSPEDRAEVAETLRELATASRQEPGCVTYIPHQVEGDPDTVLIYEQYRDAAGWRRTGSRRISRSTRWAGFTRRCGSAARKTWWLWFKPARRQKLRQSGRGGRGISGAWKWR